MNRILKFALDLAIPFVCVVVGGKMLSASFDNDSAFFFWGGLVLLAIGVVRALWLMLTNGVSPWGD